MINKLVNPNQSGFLPGDSCIHQPISVTREIYPSFDANHSLEVRGIFLDLYLKFLIEYGIKDLFIR